MLTKSDLEIYTIDRHSKACMKSVLSSIHDRHLEEGRCTLVSPGEMNRLHLRNRQLGSMNNVRGKTREYKIDEHEDENDLHTYISYHLSPFRGSAETPMNNDRSKSRARPADSRICQRIIETQVKRPKWYTHRFKRHKRREKSFHSSITTVHHVLIHQQIFNSYN